MDLKAEFLERGILSIRSNFWEVVHEAGKGGCITSIKFFNGSNRNIILTPIYSYFGSFQDVLNNRASMDFIKRDGYILVEVKGELRDINNCLDTNVEYDYTYEYHESYVKVTQKYFFKEGMAGIQEVGIGCINILPELNCFVVRPPHTGTDKNSAAIWKEINLDNEAVFECRNTPMYVAVFRKGVEGIEFLPGSNLEEWTKQFGEEDQGLFRVCRGNYPNSTQIVIRPFESRVAGRAISLTGEYTFSYYLGLPNIPEKVPRRFMHMAFGNHPWPSDEDIRRWAYAGVNVVRLHNDYHTSGDFWHDGSWPPYDEKGMSELKRVISTCHKYGVKIVPYFSLYEINPKSEAFAEGYIKWRRTVDNSGSLIETYPPDYYFGFGMCLSSGWKDFLKEYVEKVIKTLGFDGVYYDYAHYWFCNNRLHSKHDHSIIDDAIEFLEYTRKLVGKDGIILLHQSGWFPCVLITSYADAQIMLEDCSSWKEIPPLEKLPPNTMHLTFMGEKTPKIPCPNYVSLEPEKTAWNLNTKLSLFGAFPTGGLGPDEKPTLALIESFRAFDLCQFKFKDYTKNYVKTSDEAIKGAVYFNEERILVIIANTGERPVKNFRWTMDLEGMGWSPSGKYHLTGSLGDPIIIVEEKDLISSGVEDSLEGFRFKVYAVRRHQEEKKYALYNTRVWVEKCENGKLIVETRGPAGQRAILKFYSPEKPSEVKVNSKLLAQSDWVWNETTRVGVIEYIYENTEETVTIQII
ncbi:MAG: DUF6259 domain-containing protein [Thermoproteota archaeon]